MNFEKMLDASFSAIQKYAPNFQAKVGIILGSGLGPLADAIKNSIEISYEDIPEFPVSAVEGHSGTLILGELSGVPVACLKGRVHPYEGTPHVKIKLLLRTLQKLGCHTLLMTNAAGSLRRHIGPGEICLITDHINFVQHNPLVGPNDDAFGPRFVSMNNAYDLSLRKKMQLAAGSKDIPLYEGVYLWALGPCFETPAEIYAYRTLGADLAGMSTVPETIVARHCGLKVAAISAVVNLAAGMTDQPPSHEETLRYGNIASKNLCTLIATFLDQNKEELINQ